MVVIAFNIGRGFAATLVARGQDEFARVKSARTRGGNSDRTNHSRVSPVLEDFSWQATLVCAKTLCQALALCHTYRHKY